MQPLREVARSSENPEAARLVARDWVAALLCVDLFIPYADHPCPCLSRFDLVWMDRAVDGQQKEAQTDGHRQTGG